MQYHKRDLLRVLDANMNRAVEGIRVLEETARMVFDDSKLTISLKDIRHDLVNIIKDEKMINIRMLSARGADRDVLRSGETKDEQSRNDVISLVRANASRAQEAVRTMEEFIKLSFPSFSKQFKGIRFRLYDIEKSLVLRIHSKAMIDRKHLGLYVIIENDCTDKTNIYEITRNVIDEGADTVAYRDNISNNFTFLANAESFIDACCDEEVTTIIDNRLDVAMITGADGVCLGIDSFPVEACRSIAGEGFIIGAMIQNTSDFNSDSIKEADYIFLDIYYEGTRNSYDNVTNLPEIVSKFSVPVVVSSSISEENIKSILDYGVTGIAVKKYCSGAGIKPGEIKKVKGMILSGS